MTASINIAAGIVTLKGKGKAARELAYVKLAPLAYVDSQSRGELISTLRNALGSNPSEAEIEAAKQQVRIGRIASRLPASERPAGLAGDVPAILSWVANQLSSYATHDAKKVKPGQQGRRSEAFDKAMAASREYLSQIMAEVGTGNAKTQAAKNAQKATRATNENPVRGDGKTQDKAKPTHSELVKPAPATTEDDACGHVMSQAAALLGYANKNAKHLPTDFGTAIHAFKKAINVAENARQVRIAAREANAKQ